MLCAHTACSLSANVDVCLCVTPVIDHRLPLSHRYPRLHKDLEFAIINLWSAVGAKLMRATLCRMGTTRRTGENKNKSH